jgi:transcription initiation factor TFIIIB Brf1 subunit/transcription initiation factor TFIIB
MRAWTLAFNSWAITHSLDRLSLREKPVACGGAEACRRGLGCHIMKIIRSHQSLHMQSLYVHQQCPECFKAMIDAGDELVCPACGVVKEKEITEYRPSKAMAAADFTHQALGSYLGAHTPGGDERRPRGFSRSASTFGYLKLISDHAGRDDDTAYECAKMIERVSEKLGLSKVVMAEAVTVAKKVLKVREKVRRATLASVSAYSLIVACKIEGMGSVSTKEVIEAHTSLGRRVKVSSLIQLSLESGFKTEAKRAEDYLSRVVANLSKNSRLVGTLAKEGTGPSPYFHALRVQAREILSLVGDDARAGRRPFALAATSVYAAEVVIATRESRGRRISQRDVAECGETAEYTVREQFRQVFNPCVMNSRLGLESTQPLPLRPRTSPAAPRLQSETLVR